MEDGKPICVFNKGGARAVAFMRDRIGCATVGISTIGLPVAHENTPSGMMLVFKLQATSNHLRIRFRVWLTLAACERKHNLSGGTTNPLRRTETLSIFVLALAGTFCADTPDSTESWSYSFSKVTLFSKKISHK